MGPPGKHRICLTVHYDGAAFFGWQLQPAQRTVQGELERVLSRLFDAPTRVIGSGRTDTGVHAVGQVASVDAPERWTAEALHRALNALLPPEVWVRDARVVPDAFHPRYGAVERGYVYRVGIDTASRSPFRARWCWPLCEPLDRRAMSEATAALPGEHCFRAFAKAGQEERGDRCAIGRAEWRDWGQVGIEFHVTANRFLHHMVRYLVGTLVDVGRGRRDPGEMRRLLEPKTTLKTSVPAPPEGLFLHAVTYPESAWGDAGPPPADALSLP